MQSQKGKPLIVPSNAGRKLQVIGNEVTIRLSSADTSGACYIFEAVTPPGAAVPLHVHQHEDEIIQLIEGELDIFLDGKTHKATAGAVINFPKFTPHGFRNSGTKPARAVFTVIPGANFERFFAELSSLPANAPPDMAKVSDIFERYGLPIVAQPGPP